MSRGATATDRHERVSRALPRAVGAFLQRDSRIALSYRVPFFLEFAAIAFTLLSYLFVSKLVPSGRVPGDYFVFVLVGLTVSVFLIAGVSVLGATLRDEQIQGTLEALLASGLPAGSIALGMSAYPMVSAGATAIIYIVVGAAFGARTPPDANWSLALVALLLASVAFVGVGLVGAALVLLFRRAAAATGWLVAILALAGGQMFPPDLLPGWLEAASQLSPFTQVLALARGALLEGANWGGSFARLAVLAIEGVGYLFIGLWLLSLSVQRVRRTGGIAQY